MFKVASGFAPDSMIDWPIGGERSGGGGGRRREGWLAQIPSADPRLAACCCSGCVVCSPGELVPVCVNDSSKMFDFGDLLRVDAVQAVMTAVKVVLDCA